MLEITRSNLKYCSDIFCCVCGCVLGFLFCFVFERAPHYKAQAGLELRIPVSPLSI